ncbi:hypothetical protein TNCV_2690271 [Trichonephila clavipes]|uniref:Uncharacterized protein n=1 Tax=Trichonephila clavipes TaxID=2585209 RepID=A0A8X6VYV5_TRICX|nr:hypothetical protein TNCV_2690271 [Trichonephila clavipes]
MRILSINLFNESSAPVHYGGPTRQKSTTGQKQFWPQVRVHDHWNTTVTRLQHNATDSSGIGVVLTFLDRDTSSDVAVVTRCGQNYRTQYPSRLEMCR